MSQESDPSDRSHALTNVSGLSAPLVAAFKKQWIETAEQVLAIAASARGREGLKDLLSFDEEQLAGLLATLTRAVGPEQAARLSSDALGGSLGLMLTPEQKKRFGMD